MHERKAGRREGEEGGWTNGWMDRLAGPGIHPGVPCTPVQAGPHTCRSSGTAALAHDQRDGASQKDTRTCSQCCSFCCRSGNGR